MTSEDLSPREGEFQGAYAGSEKNLNLRLISGARAFLEKQYLDYVRSSIEKHPSRAQLGGKPGIEEEIKAYLKVRLPANSKYNSSVNHGFFELLLTCLFG